MTMQVDEKGWRVVSSYLEMSQHQGKIANPTKLPGSSDDPRSRQFDPKLHKSLNSELKYLYTAVTRAKCNLWIYDSDRKTRLPVFDYWHKRDLVKVVKKEDQLSCTSKESQDNYFLVFASNSTPEQWKAQGDNFKKKHLWEQAILCYQHAGSENEYLATEAHAYHLIQRARHQKPQLYLEAALSFLECDELHHNLHYINGAAICLRNSKPPKYHEAAKLFERLGESEKAAQSYLRGRDIDNYARLKESVGQHGDVVRALMGKPFMRKRDALAKSSEYEKQGIKLHQDLSASELSYSCAKFYSQRRDKDTLIEVLAYMPEVSRKIKFLKEAKLYDKAFEFLVENEELKSAYRLASAQSGELWLQKGLKIAKTNKDEVISASFIFQLAKVEYKQLQANNQQDEANTDVVKYLDTLIRNKNKLIKAHACLLLGMLRSDVALCRTAWRTYHSENHKVGELEAFNQVLKLAPESDQSIINMCHVAKEAANTLTRARDINKLVKEALGFYGLQKIDVYYYTPPGQDIWIGEALMKCVCKGSKYDLDGMLKLEASDARDELAKHCRNFKSKWLSQFDLQKKIEPKVKSFPLHQQLRKHHHLLRVYSMEEVSVEALYEYLSRCLHLLEIYCLEEEGSHELIDLLVSIFTPRVYFYLPQRIRESHITIFRKSVNCHGLFQHNIKEYILTNKSADLDPFPSRVKVDTWFAAWRASCVVDPSMKSLREKLQFLENTVNKDHSATQGYKCPPGFIYWDNDQKFYHIFSIWMKSCAEMREEGKFLWASKLAINHFLGNIAQHTSECSLQVMNAVDMLSIHCTGLLAVLAHVNGLQQRSTSYTVPLFYKSNVYLFSLMNCSKKEDRYLLSACADEVRRSRNIRKLFGQCRQLLVRALEVILGTSQNSPHYSVLNIGLKNIPLSDATKQCLILALVLFGNLSMLNVYETNGFFQKIQLLLGRFIQQTKESVPWYVSTVYEATQKANLFINPFNVFNLVGLLLKDAHVDSTLAQFVFKDKGVHSKIEIIPIRRQQKYAQTNSLLQSPKPPIGPTYATSSTNHPVSTAMSVSQTTPLGGTSASAIDQHQDLCAHQATNLLPTHVPSTMEEPSDTTVQNQHKDMSESVAHEAQQHTKSSNDKDNAEVVISPTQYEIGFNFDAPEDIEEPIQFEPEGEQDEDMSMALTSGTYDLLSQINPELIDSEMVTPTFCNACGVSLKSDDHSESSEPVENIPEFGDEAAPKEFYHNHVTSEMHNSNVILCKKLAVAKGEKEIYASLRHRVTSLLQNFKDHHDTDELDRPIDSIQEKLEESDMLLAELEESCSWGKAISEIYRMQDLLDRFMKIYSERLTQVIEKSKQFHQTHYRAMDSIEDNVDDVESILEDQLSERFDISVKAKKTKKKPRKALS